MAYFTAVQAATFFNTKSSPPGGWDELTPDERLVFLEQASDRFDALPWLDAWDTEAKRVASVPITAAFYEYVRYLSERGGRGSQSLGRTEDPDELNSLADLPNTVAARLIPFLDAAQLSVGASASVQVGGDTILFNPAEETASQAAERYAKARLADAQAGDLLTEAEQAQQRPMRSMSFEAADPVAPMTPDTPSGGAAVDEGAVNRLIRAGVKDYAEVGGRLIELSDLDPTARPGSGEEGSTGTEGKLFESSALTWTTQSVAHGLSAVPDLVWAVLKIKRAWNGYAAGETAFLGSMMLWGISTTAQQLQGAFTLTSDDTNLDFSAHGRLLPAKGETHSSGPGAGALLDAADADLHLYAAILGTGGGGGSAQVKAFAAADGRPIALGDLLETDADQIEAAFSVVRSTWNQTTRTLTLVSNDQRSLTITLPPGLPGYGQGDAGQALRVAADGGSVRWAADPPAELDTAGVNRAIDARVPSWARMRQRFTDDQQEALAAFIGPAWRALAGAGIATTFATVANPSNVENDTYTSSVEVSPRYTNVYAKVRIPAAQVAKVGLGQVRFRMAETDHPTAQTNLLNGAGVHLVETESDYTYYTVLVPDAPVGADLYVEELIPFQLDPKRVADLPAPWATRGNTDLVPDAKLPPHVAAPTSFGQVNPGLTLTRTDTSRAAAAPYELSPLQTIEATTRGEYHWALDLRIAPVSDVNMGFVRGKANQTAADRTVNLTTILFASDLWQESPWTSGATTNGLEMFEVPVYSLNTLVGTYTILLVRQMVGAALHVRPYWYWTGAAGATGATLTAELRGSFTASDGAGGAAGPSAPASALYSAVSQLPAAASLATGLEARVASANSVSKWMVDGAASGSRRWRMLAGVVPLVNVRVDITVASTWVDSGVALGASPNSIFEPFDYLSISVDGELPLAVLPAAPFKNLRVVVPGTTGEGSGPQIYDRILGRLYYNTAFMDVLFDIGQTAANNLAVRTHIIRPGVEFAPLIMNGVPG